MFVATVGRFVVFNFIPRLQVTNYGLALHGLERTYTQPPTTVQKSIIQTNRIFICVQANVTSRI
jgi:hypothetical protein